MTDKQAIKKTITHWREDYKELSLFGGTVKRFFVVFNDQRCWLCKTHYRYSRQYKSGRRCGRCPLAVGALGHGCRGGSPWWKAKIAWAHDNKPMFMSARAALLKRLKRALAKYD